MKWRLLCLAFLAILISCKKQKGPEINIEANLADTALLTFNNVVILGNSVTYAPANPSVGWYCDCGMAASVPESDYVHILKSCFRVQNPNVTVRVKNIASFEIDPMRYDFDAELKELRDTRPDLVIIKLGEDVPPNSDMVMFDKRYTALINYFKAGNPNVIVLSGGSIWSTMIDDIVVKHPPYVLLTSILNDQLNLARGKFASYGISSHPSDKGMRFIASMLWAKIKIIN